MGDLRACPHCGRTAEESAFHNWFPVYTCRKCGQKYCRCCAQNGSSCPKCGSPDRGEYDKVYA